MKITILIFSLISLTRCTDHPGQTIIYDYHIINNGPVRVEMELFVRGDQPNESGIKSYEKKFIINVGDTISYVENIETTPSCFFNANFERGICVDSAVLKFDNKLYLSHYFGDNDNSTPFDRNIIYASSFDQEGIVNGRGQYYYYITDEDYELASPY